MQGPTFAPSETRPVGALPLPALPCPVTPRPAALVTLLWRSLSLLDMMQGRRGPEHRAAMEVHIRLTAPWHAQDFALQGPGVAGRHIRWLSICHEAGRFDTMPPSRSALLLVMLGAIVVRLAVGLHSYSGLQMHRVDHSDAWSAPALRLDHVSSCWRRDARPVIATRCGKAAKVW